MENKKISFGFSKITKKTELLPKPKQGKPVDLIDCFEDQAIKIKGGCAETEVKPLIIPLVGSSNKLVDEIKKAREKNKEEVKTEEEKPDSELTIEELAARELIREAQNRDSVKTETKVFTVPLKKEEEKFVADGAEESSLNDYESVPIADYGMAMLRGMNWQEGMPIGKRGKKVEAPKLPELRPRGLGLGANKLVNSSKPAENSEELKLVKGSFCKIIAGNHRGHYCQVQGFDDESYKVIVKTSITNEVLSLNEFLIVPVSREEYGKSSRVINNAKYEAYKESSRGRSEDGRSRSRSPDGGESRKSKNKSKKSKHKSHSSDRDKKKHKKKKSKRRDSSSDSDHRRRHKERQ